MKINNSIVLVLLMPLAALFLTGADRFKDIYKDKPTYIRRNGVAWDKKGRVVGLLKNPPEELTIEFYNISQGKVTYTYKAPGKLFIYLSNYLPADIYNITFKSPGFHDCVVRKVKVRKGADCMLNITFGSRVYVN